ncbi:SAM-dependent methyltransferase [Marispirochaeta sp.]|jgi:tRNA (adenine37-N6)-methyltransferase|uniref:SAM-dependent methyltransferase n=1 Tax=Marispirochaeta sp. TaxID=2038653 RepID=UPI0029C987F5|nr:SAM-dependent methyltransferase [Marispirochaeta sp.]
MEKFELRTIGVLRMYQGRYWAEIDEQYRLGLDGLEGFSHINVLFWCHLLDSPEQRALCTCKKPYQKAPKSLGVFATRSPARPNPIALTVCEITGIDEKSGRIELAFIDAEDRSPIVDIKPYHPAIDRVREANVPGWCSHWPDWYEDSAVFDWNAEFVNTQ